MAAAMTNKETNSTSSGYVDMIDKDSTIQSWIGSSTETDISDISTAINSEVGRIAYSISYNENETYTGTEFCSVCVLKTSDRKKATHFCTKCDTRGRYICHKCMKEHALWASDHEVVSLSYDERKSYHWNNAGKNTPAIHVPDDSIYNDITGLRQGSSAGEDCEYGELNEFEMVSNRASVNDSDYTRALSDTVISQRQRLPLAWNDDKRHKLNYVIGTNNYTELDNTQQRSERDYEEYRSDETERKTLPDDNLEHVPRRRRDYEEYRSDETERKTLPDDNLEHVPRRRRNFTRASSEADLLQTPQRPPGGNFENRHVIQNVVSGGRRDRHTIQQESDRMRDVYPSFNDPYNENVTYTRTYGLPAEHENDYESYTADKRKKACAIM